MNCNLVAMRKLKSDYLFTIQVYWYYKLWTLQLEQIKIWFKTVSERLQISQVLGHSFEKSEVEWTASEFFSDETLVVPNLEIVSFARGICWEQRLALPLEEFTLNEFTRQVRNWLWQKKTYLNVTIPQFSSVSLITWQNLTCLINRTYYVPLSRFL